MLPQADGAPVVAGRAYLRFVVPHHQVRGVAWAPVPWGQLFEESFAIRVPQSLARRLRFRIGAGADGGIYLDFGATFQAAMGVVDCHVYLLAPVPPGLEALPVAIPAEEETRTGR